MITRSEFLHHFPDFTWDFTPEVIEKRSMDLIGDINQRIENITCLSEDNINFQSVCQSLADIEEDFERERSIIEVYRRTSPVIEVQYKCLELSKMWSEFFVNFIMRRDIYDLLTKIQSTEKWLSYESDRYLKKSLLYKRRDGLHLEADLREKLTELLKKMSNLCTDFSTNISNEDTKIEFKKKHLLGMPEDFFTGLTKKDGKYIVTLKDSHVVPILKHCKVIKTRQIMEKGHNSRCIDKNVKILEDVLELRNEIAKILGYKTHADFVTEISMSKSAARVDEFLTALFEQIQNGLNKEMERLLELKKEECLELGVPFDGKINVYDCSYYENMVEEEDYWMDKDLINEYFPFEHVTTQLMNIYQTVLCLKFVQVPDPPVIHPDVLLYAVFDKETNSLMGYFYMDLIPRPFKFPNTIFYGIQDACHYKNKPQLGCAVMIANFDNSYPGKPTLLTHEEIIKYFHEFGHVMHQICSKTRYSLFQ